MKISPLSVVVPLALSAALALPTLAQDATGQRNPAADFAALEAAQKTANAKAGPRIVPGRSIPVPSTASPSCNFFNAASHKSSGTFPEADPARGRQVVRAEPMSTLDAELNDFGAQLAMLGGHAADRDG